METTTLSIPALPPRTQNTLPFQARANLVLVSSMVLSTHVMPSVLMLKSEEDVLLTAQNTVPFQTRLRHAPALAIVL